MNTSERLKNIAKARENRENAERIAAAKQMNEKELYYKKLAEQGERINELIKVAQSMLSNGFTLGKKTSWDSVPSFISCGIYHKFGFIVAGNPYFNPLSVSVRGVGYVGGGVCGSNDLVVNRNGITEFSDYFYKTRQINKVLADLDQFEKEFYNYVDSL